MLGTFGAAVLVGLILGLLGSGGSAVMVPILTYLVGHEAKIAIAESMAIVGAISAVAAIPFALQRQIDWKSVLFFGIPAMLGTFVGAWLGGLASDALQLVVFGVVLILAAALMVRRAFGFEGPKPAADPPVAPTQKIRFKSILIFAEGLSVGALTGFVGVGGGFLIVPALLVLGKLPMRTAIATSLVIIVMKSLVGFIKYQHYLLTHNMSVDWPTIAIFVGIGILGSLIGQRINSKMNQKLLTQIFAVFLILIGALVLFKEGSQLFQDTGMSARTRQINSDLMFKFERK